MTNPSSSAGVRARAEQIAEDALKSCDLAWHPLMVALKNDLALALYPQIEAFALAERADALREAQPQWQPIETAPKDGTHVLGFDGRTMATVLWWSRHQVKGKDCATHGWWQLVEAGTYASDDTWKPTHWQPLPAPPSSATTGKAQDSGLLGCTDNADCGGERL